MLAESLRKHLKPDLTQIPAFYNARETKSANVYHMLSITN